ncbi:hypothetical protein G6F56_006135 [Rhizopus delemar]|nr:hypothetical protein G6F56_006135 [Rhizopus delemar]
MKEYAIDCNYEHPVHSLVLDTSDKIWKKYSSGKEIFEIKSYNNKQFRDLPVVLRTYLDSLKESNDAVTLKKSWTKNKHALRVSGTLAGIERMERKLMGRKLDFIFYRQLFEYGCCECGRSENQTKELLDDSKMAKVLKDTKFTIVLCDSPAGYVCHINHKRTLDLPEEADDICNALLPILTAVYKSRVMMEDTNKLVKQKPVDIDADLD